MLIFNANINTAITGNYRIAPSAVGECLPEITGLDNGKPIKALVFNNLKTQRITGFYRIK